MTLAITLGEPAGIGLELVTQLKSELTDCVLVGDRQLVLEAMPDFNEANIHHVSLKTAVRLGKLNKANANYVLATIKAATEGCLSGRYQAMVTNPIHKAIINEAGIRFSGHTEYLAQLTDTQHVVMMLLNEVMRVALVTTHMPLKQVASHITEETISRVIQIVVTDLEHKLGIKNPHLAVCGLNPHAGEGGHLGHEENDIIIPTLEKLTQQGYHLTGPLPADTLFTPHQVEKYDAIIAMYHDQGLAPLKYAGFGRSVNITLGLPIIRTSVDHGTALDIAGKGIADAGSLRAAIKLARDCVQNQTAQF